MTCRRCKICWVGHALRRKDGDLPKDTVKQELARKSSHVDCVSAEYTIWRRSTLEVWWHWSVRRITGRVSGS